MPLPFTRRFRQVRVWLLPLVAVACLDSDKLVDPEAPQEPIARLVLTPERVATGPSGQVRFDVVGLTASGDTAPISVAWAAKRGTVAGASGVNPTNRGNGKKVGHYKADNTTGQDTVVVDDTSGVADTAIVDVEPEAVATVDVAPATAALAVGATVPLTATPRDAEGNALSGRQVLWSSSDEDVATVSSSGLVTGVSAGSSTITATSEGESGTASVTVTNVPVASVAVSPSSASLETGETVQLSATVADADGNELTGRSVAWSSSATGVATVSSSGLVTGVTAGSATITATSEGQSGSATVTVTESAPPPPPPTGGTATVQATVETDPSHNSGDTADDVAIWIHPSDPALSLVIGDDKEGGLMVWGLNGRELQYINGTLYNNLDLRYNFPLAGQFSGGGTHQSVALVGVADEGGEQIDFFKVNPSARRLEPAGSIDLGLVPYGACMYHSAVSGKYYYFVNAKSGAVEQWELRDGGGGQVGGTRVRSFDVGSQPEGCVADDILGDFYIGEEDVGIWKYGAEPGDGSTRTQVDRTSSGGHLVADVEGLALYYAGPTQGYLLASSQGNSMVVVYTREGDNAFVGRFEVEGSGSIDGVSESDGLEVTNFPLGAGFPLGMVAVHDAANSGASASNIKFVPWQAVASGLGLVVDTSFDPRTVGQ